MNSKTPSVLTGLGEVSAAVMARPAMGVARVAHCVSEGKLGIDDILPGLKGEDLYDMTLIVSGQGRPGMDEGRQRFPLTHEALKMTVANGERAVPHIRQIEQAGLLNRTISQRQLQHTVQRDTKGMG